MGGTRAGHIATAERISRVWVPRISPTSVIPQARGLSRFCFLVCRPVCTASLCEVRYWCGRSWSVVKVLLLRLLLGVGAALRLPLALLPVFELDLVLAEFAFASLLL